MEDVHLNSFVSHSGYVSLYISMLTRMVRDMINHWRMHAPYIGLWVMAIVLSVRLLSRNRLPSSFVHQEQNVTGFFMVLLAWLSLRTGHLFCPSASVQ